MPYLPLALTLAFAVGLAGGVATDVQSPLVIAILLSGSWTTATLAYRLVLPRVQVPALLLLLATAGWTFGVRAIDQATTPSLRTLLDREFGGFAIDAVDEGVLAEPLIVEGRLREDAAPGEGGTTLRIDVSMVRLNGVDRPAAGGISVSVGGAPSSSGVRAWTAGRTIRAPVILRRPARYENQGLSDQERALALRGVTLVGAIKSARLIEILHRGTRWEEAAARVRRRTRAAIARHVAGVGTPAPAIATAILIGDRGGLDPETERRLQEAGTYHVIAISGGNIAILVGLVLGSLAWLGVRGRLAAAMTLFVLAIYPLIAGGGASVARASLTAAIYLAVRLIDQRTSAGNAIGVTAAILLLASPLSIVDVGFWLTFGATIAILVGAALIPMPAFTPARIVAAVLAASCAVELALAPVSALIFQRVTAAGLLLNFAALPAMTAVQVAAMGVVGCDAAGLDAAADALGWIVRLASRILTGSASSLDYAPFAAWRVPSPSSLLILGYYAAIAIVVWHHLPERRTGVPQSRSSEKGSGRSRWRHLAAVAAGCLLVWIVAAPLSRVPPSRTRELTLTMFDVGQGDSMLVTFPNGRRLVVDAGGSGGGAFDIGERVLGPSLRARGITRLDYLAVTHGDPDHLGGAVSLLRDFTPQEVWWGVDVPAHAPSLDVHREADRIRAAWRTLQQGDRLDIGGVELRVHHPPTPDWERRRVRNDDSLVIELRYGDVSMLLTGDIGRDVEQSLLSTLDLRPTVVLKVAHHGSATSSSATLLDRIHPVIALIGVGRANPYGHPVRAVLDRLRDSGAAVFRTDQEGQIDVSTDGESVDVRTFASRRFHVQRSHETRKHESTNDHESRKESSSEVSLTRRD